MHTAVARAAPPVPKWEMSCVEAVPRRARLADVPTRAAASFIHTNIHRASPSTTTHYTLHTEHCTLHTEHYTLPTYHYTLHTYYTLDT